MSLAALLLAPLLFATPHPPATASDTLLPLGTRHRIESRALGASREIWLHLPADYDSTGPAYPVLYVLDAHGLFPTTVALTDYLRLVGRAPAVIVVGIVSESATDRGRNFTPVPASDSLTRARFPGSGQAGKFLRFLTDELQPYLRQRVRAAPEATLIGHSLAGLFTLYALAEAPAHFTNYIAISPSAGWAGGEVFERLTRRLASGSLQGRFLYASVGNESAAYQEAAARIAALVRGAPASGLRSVSDRFPAEDHTTTVPPALAAALRATLDTTWSRSH